MSRDFPEARVRQPAFTTVTATAGLTSIDSMRTAFDVDLDEIETAVRGGPVSPGFVASVLITFSGHTFRDLFQLEIDPTDRFAPPPRPPGDG